MSATNLTFTIKGPGGATIATRNLGAAAVQPSTGPARAQIVFPVAELGDYSLAVTGRIGPGGGYDVSGLVVPPKTSVLYFWWEDLVFGSAAASKAQSAGLLPGAPGSATGNAHPTMSMSPSATANGHAP